MAIFRAARASYMRSPSGQRERVRLAVSNVLGCPVAPERLRKLEGKAWVWDDAVVRDTSLERQNATEAVV